MIPTPTPPIAMYITPMNGFFMLVMLCIFLAIPAYLVFGSLVRMVDKLLTWWIGRRAQ